MLTFCVTSDGWWSLRWLPLGTQTSGSGDSIRIGKNSAIHWDSDTPNRIAVLVQGSDFTFYINGHYMTRYHDDHLAGGYTGLYLDPSAEQGTFIDFAIYPV